MSVSRDENLEPRKSTPKQVPSVIQHATYARARLWLGITGVGSLVVISSMLLASQALYQVFSAEPASVLGEFAQLSSAISLVSIFMLPLDWLGGFILPRRYGRSKQRVSQWLWLYIPAVMGQVLFFLGSALAILILGRWFGVAGVSLAILLGLFLLAGLRAIWMHTKKDEPTPHFAKLRDVEAHLRSWEISIPRILVVKVQDPGFTGGIVGWASMTKVILPAKWLDLETDKLAVTVARRALSISNGSYRWGVITAVAWNTVGFCVATLLPGGGYQSVVQLLTSLCWFTLWSFTGLLILPTFSRVGFLSIDHLLEERGVPQELIRETARSLDAWQDDEPSRNVWIETIFHPIPSLEQRQSQTASTGRPLWNVARTTLALSWPCLGFLSRAVHCNVGRPELWLMLPSD